MIDHVVSLATGHQKPEGSSHRRAYAKERNAKLKDQRDETITSVLSNTRIYINGYLRGTTDIEMKRVITEAGGQILFVQDFYELQTPDDQLGNRLLTQRISSRLNR
jgi:hypothetical protein